MENPITLYGKYHIMYIVCFFNNTTNKNSKGFDLMEDEKKGLTAGHLTMMALGTVIGGSFFLGSSVAIQSTGPSIILSYIVCGILVYFILFALSEMTVSTQAAGSFRTFASQYISEGTGYVVGWVYWTGMVIAMSSEATAVSLLVREWYPTVSLSLLGAFIIVVVTLLNLLGARQLSRLEGMLAAIKIFAIAAFIILGLLLIVGFIPGIPAVKSSLFRSEPFLKGGIKNLAGSMLIVLFTYAGFEIIGLAATEAKDKQKTIPKAIHATVFSLITLYILCITVLLFLVPTVTLNDNVSPLVSALNRYNLNWAGTAMNIILISAILSTMLAAMFGLGRMLRSLVEDGLGPKFLKDKTDVPYRGILFSGFSMLCSLFVGLLFPRVYLFLISSGGFALLFTYIVLMFTHIRYRRKNGKPKGNCHMCGFPYSSFFTLIGLLVAMFSMPFAEGQTAGFFAGLLLVLFYSASYFIIKFFNARKLHKLLVKTSKLPSNGSFITEFSDEFHKSKHKNSDKN
ncbi:L-asparagine transporter-like permease [Lachnotalea glycerini]|uniref:L-asparagine transporter-like permease n=2 Tax=Lachnotalea glycerini TaxID=1763509 RepID=A0A318EQV6_9FIRM|nr:L-asparagine transporter-like permease [Lachnotalea glycerini]